MCQCPFASSRPTLTCKRCALYFTSSLRRQLSSDRLNGTSDSSDLDLETGGVGTPSSRPLELSFPNAGFYGGCRVPDMNCPYCQRVVDLEISFGLTAVADPGYHGDGHCTSHLQWSPGRGSHLSGTAALLSLPEEVKCYPLLLYQQQLPGRSVFTYKGVLIAEPSCSTCRHQVEVALDYVAFCRIRSAVLLGCQQHISRFNY